MIGLQLLIAVLALAGCVVGAYFYSQKCIEWFLNKDAEDLEFILDTRQVPARWSLKRAKKIARMREKGADSERLERAKARANKRYVKRMNRMMAFARGAPVFEGESHRQVALEDLKAIREEWRRREYLHDPY